MSDNEHEKSETSDGYWHIQMIWPLDNDTEGEVELTEVEEEEWSVLRFSDVAKIIEKMTNYIAVEINFVQFTDPDRI